MQTKFCNKINCGFLLLFVALLAGMGTAQAAIQFSGHVGGATTTNVITDGNHIYLGQGQDFVVLSNNNNTLNIVGKYTTPDLINKIYINGSNAYIANRYNGVMILDITNPAAPTLKGQTGEFFAADVITSGMYAYVAAGNLGINVLDISNSTAIRHVSTIPTSGFVNAIENRGNNIYAATNAGLEIYDINNPILPIARGKNTQATGAKNIVLYGDKVYVARGTNGTDIISADVTSPITLGRYQPTVTHPLGLVNVRDIAVTENNIFLADDLNGVEILTNTDNPTLISNIHNRMDENGQIRIGIASGITIFNNRAYVSGGYSGLNVIDVTNPAAPTVVAHNNMAAGYSRDVANAGNKIALAYGYGGVLLVDNTNPASLLVNSVLTNAFAGGIDVDANGNYAYASIGAGGIDIIDMRDINTATLASRFPLNGGVTNNAKVADNRLYIAAGPLGLVVADISNQTAPQVIGSASVGYAEDVFIYNNYAYVVLNDNGLAIVNIATPENPTIEGTVDTAGTAQSVAAAGNYAYVADGTNGLVVIDVSNKAAPRIIGGMNTSSASDIVVLNDIAYIADDTRGLTVINVANPAAPALVENYGTPGISYGTSVAIAANNAYMADFDNGLVILTNITGTGSVTVPTQPISPTLLGDNVGVFDPATATWALGNPENPTITQLGTAGRNNIPVTGDWDGDGTIELGIYDTQGNYFVVEDDVNGSKQINLGWNGVKPIIGDWNGDGTDDVGVFDPTTATWALGNPENPTITQLGTAGRNNIPVTGDWDGDGTIEPGIYDTQGNYFVVEDDVNGSKQINLGWNGVKPIIGDWNGDGTDDVGVFDPTTATWALGNPENPTIIQFGPSQTSIPVVGDWNNDRTTDIGIYDINANCFVVRDVEHKQINLGWNGVKPIIGDWA